MKLSTGLMALPILGMAFLPLNTSWEPGTLTLLTIYRIFQGILVGGEYGAIATYVIEMAPQNRKGVFGALVNSVACLGILFAQVVVTLFLHYSSHAFMSHTGWRISYLIGFIATLIVIVLQSALKETSSFLEEKKNDCLVNNPLSTIMKNQKGITVKVLILNGLGAGIYFLITGYLVILLTDYIHYAREDVMRYVSFGGVLGVLFSIFCGWRSDIQGRKQTLIICTVLTLMSVYGVFYFMIHSSTGSCFISYFNNPFIWFYNCT